MDDKLIKFVDTSDSVEFIEYMNSESTIETNNSDVQSSFAEFVFEMANTKYTYQRETDSLLAFIGDTGGILEIIMTFGALLTGYLTDKAFFGSLISKIYLVQRRFSRG